MKKIFLAVIAFAMICTFASCWHSEERAVNDNLSTYTVKENGYLGLKKTGAPAGDNLTDAIYVQVEDANGYLLAQCKKDADGVSRWALLDGTTAKPVSELRYEKVWIGKGFFTMQAKDSKYFLLAGQGIFGPNADLAFYPSEHLFFTKSDGKWGVQEVSPEGDDPISIKEAYNRLLMITDGSENRFVGIDGKKAVLLDPSGKILKKNIPVATVTKLEQNNKKAWDYQNEVGVLVVKNVKTAI